MLYLSAVAKEDVEEKAKEEEEDGEKSEEGEEKEEEEKKLAFIVICEQLLTGIKSDWLSPIQSLLF